MKPSHVEVSKNFSISTIISITPPAIHTFRNLNRGNEITIPLSSMFVR